MAENELHNFMERLYKKQQRCLRIQKFLILLTIVLYKYGIILLPAHLMMIIIFGGVLSNKATSLSREKYPYVLLRTSRIGKGYGWDPYIIEEAKRVNDELTVKILSFSWRTIYCFLTAMFGNILIWILAKVME